MHVSFLVEQNPSRECEDDHQRRIDERRRTNVRFQVAHLDNPMRDERERQSADDADHPRRKIGTENVDGRRMVTEKLHSDECDNEQCERGGDNSENPGFHLSKGLTGLPPCTEGRAKSPVLNASAVAVVKMADCVSWLTLRADARLRCALTISG